MIHSKQLRGRRSWAIGLGATTLVLALAACGGEDQQPGVATAASAGAQPSASATVDALTAYVEDRRQLAKCLREQGYDVPDPDVKGYIDFRSINQKKTDPKVRAAWEACKEFGQVPSPDELAEPETLTEEQLARLREYAKCMRANGMPEWSDPAPDGSFSGYGRELTEQEQAANIRALQICEPVQEGKPPTTPDPNKTYQG